MCYHGLWISCKLRVHVVRTDRCETAECWVPYRVFRNSCIVMSIVRAAVIFTCTFKYQFQLWSSRLLELTQMGRLSCSTYLVTSLVQELVLCNSRLIGLLAAIILSRNIGVNGVVTRPILIWKLVILRGYVIGGSDADDVNGHEVKSRRIYW